MLTPDEVCGNASRIARAVVVVVKIEDSNNPNGKKVELKRFKYAVSSGEWDRAAPPPESLDPSVTSVFAVHSSGFATGAAAVVTYDLVVDGKYNISSLKFDVDFPFSKLKSPRTEVLVEGKSDDDNAKQNNSLQVTNTSTTSSKSWYMMKHCELVRLDVSLKIDRVAIDTLLAAGALGKTDDVDDLLDEQARLTGRAARVAVRNELVGYTLKRSAYKDESGSWNTLPAEEIKPGEISKFSTQSSKLMQGTRGFVCYSIIDQDLSPPSAIADVKLTWHNPFGGPKVMDCLVSHTLTGAGASLFAARSHAVRGATADVLFSIFPSQEKAVRASRADDANDTFESLASCDWRELEATSPLTLCIASICKSILSAATTETGDPAKLLLARGSSSDVAELRRANWTDDSTTRYSSVSAQSTFLRQLLVASNQFAIPDEWASEVMAVCKRGDRVMIRQKFFLMSQSVVDFVLAPLLMMFHDLCVLPMDGTEEKFRPTSLQRCAHVFAPIMLPLGDLRGDSLDLERTRSAAFALLIQHAPVIFGDPSIHLNDQESARLQVVTSMEHLRSEVSAVEAALSLVDQQLTGLQRAQSRGGLGLGGNKGSTVMIQEKRDILLRKQAGVKARLRLMGAQEDQHQHRARSSVKSSLVRPEGVVMRGSETSASSSSSNLADLP